VIKNKVASLSLPGRWGGNPLSPPPPPPLLQKIGIKAKEKKKEKKRKQKNKILKQERGRRRGEKRDAGKCPPRKKKKEVRSLGVDMV
jgi:hypothetical protein